MVEILLILATAIFLFILLQLREKANDKQESENFFNIGNKQQEDTKHDKR